MANHQIPRTAKVIEDLTALTDDGQVAHLRVYRHTRAGHDRPEFILLWYADLSDGRIDRRTRVTQQFSGARAQHRLDTAMVSAHAEFAAAIARNGTLPASTP